MEVRRISSEKHSATKHPKTIGREDSDTCKTLHLDPRTLWLSRRCYASNPSIYMNPQLPMRPQCDVVAEDATNCGHMASRGHNLEMNAVYSLPWLDYIDMLYSTSCAAIFNFTSFLCSCSVRQADLRLVTLLPLLPKCKGDRHTAPHLAACHILRDAYVVRGCVSCFSLFDKKQLKGRRLILAGKAWGQQ